MRSGIVENMSCTMDDFVYIHELWFIDFSCMYVCLLLKCQALDLLLSPVCVCDSTQDGLVDPMCRVAGVVCHPLLFMFNCHITH